MSSSSNWLTASFSWIRHDRKAPSRLKAPRFCPSIEYLEGRLNPAPVASLPQLLDMPHSLVVLSPDIASQVPVAEYAGARVLTLDPTRDTISQISDSLAGQSSVTSLRVIGHGQPGSLSLAGQTINLATLQARSVEVAAWARHLTPDADILLYGCSVASTAGGRAFVNTLATLTGADVAASTDPTGAGGNLTLEYNAGVVTDHLHASPQAWTKSGLQLPSEGDYNYDTNPDGTSVTITGYTGPGGAVTIPGTLGGLPVTAIGNDAFYNESSLTSVTIPESVTSIRNNAFMGCRSLTSVAIPESVTSIGDGALRNCSSLTGVTIPENVTAIGEWAFAGCSRLTAIEVAVTNNDFRSRDGILFNKAQTTLIQCPGGKKGSYTIPESVTFIGDGAFDGCGRLTSVTIPESVTAIGDGVFSTCDSLRSLTLPSTITSIGRGAFALCASLTSVTIPESVTFIGNEAFAYCYGLLRINTLSNAPTLGGDHVFYLVPATLYYTPGTTGWTNPWGGLPTVELADDGYQISINIGGTSVTIIGYTGPGGALTIPATLAGLPVTAIGESAFDSCGALTSLTIPQSVTSIGDGAFMYCGGLTGVTIPESVTAIGNEAFAHCSSLTSVMIPSSANSIGEWAFNSCSSLTSVTILQGVSTIGAGAFYSCGGLTSVTIPQSVTAIGNSAFSSCSSLTAIEVDVTNNDFSSRDGILFNKAQTTLIQCPGGKKGTYTIPESVTAIGMAAFRGCNGLTGVTIPESVTAVGDSAFSSCSSLTSMTIPSSITSIGDSVFSSCSSLISLTIPSSVISIGEWAFSSCSSLTSLTIPSSVTSIGGGAFSDCNSLTAIEVDVTNNDFSSRDGILFNKAQTILIQYPGGKAGTYTIPSSVTSIGGGAFDSCNGLTTVTLPESVTTIGESAFAYCSGLTRINTLGNAPALGDDYVFANVPATLYYTLGTTGWTNPWGDLPTVEMTGGDYQFSINSDSTSVTITGYTGPGGAVNIPDTLVGLPVTGIGRSAFEQNWSLTSVTIPKSITSIGEWAFALCSSLTSVTIPSSVTSIRDSTFESCDRLTSITILSSVTSIGDNAFFNCGRLTGVTIPSSVTSIGDSAFGYCSSLTAIEVAVANNDFSSRDGILFNKAQTNLIQCPGGKSGAYTIFETITSIGNKAFGACRSLTSVTIPKSVTSIGDAAFIECTGLTRINTLGNAPALDGSQVFLRVPATLYYTSGTTGWTNPWGGLPTVEMTGGDYQFSINSDGTSVTITGYTGPGGTVTIPDTLVGLPVTGIAFQAFAFNTSLTSVTIPNSVISVGQEAFYRCDNLTAIAVDVANYNFSSRDGILFNKAQTDLIQCPGGKAGPVTIPASVTSIGNQSFAYCSSLTSVTIPESVTSIGDQSLRDCSSLTSVMIPKSVTSIGENAVAFCGSLTAIEVDAANNDFSSRGGILFNKAQTLLIQYPGGKAGPYTIPESVTSIRDWAFSYCRSLTSVIIPSSVTSVGDWAFDSCGGLTTVTLPESIASIGNGAFAYCFGLTRINSLGNAPALGGSNVFDMVPATLYYTSGTTGWTNPWGGLPTVESSPVAAPFSLAAGSTVASLGNGQIGIWSATGDYQAIYPFPGYTGTLNVNTVNRAVGLNADTIVVAVAGHSSPHVLTIDSATGFVTSSFYAFDPGFLGGVTVAGGVTRIGGEITVSPEGVVTLIGGVITTVIICGAGSGSAPSVSVFNADSNTAMGAFYAYSTQYLGGVRVALSEAGADGISFAIIGSTINSHVVVFDLNDYYNPILSFNTFPDILTPNGVYVASGDLDRDGLNEMGVGAGQGTTSPQVAVFDMAGRLKKSFNAFDMSFLGGVQVGVADYNKDGKLDILAASGVGAPGILNVFNYDNLALLDTLFISDSTLGFDVASNFSRG